MHIVPNGVLASGPTQSSRMARDRARYSGVTDANLACQREGDRREGEGVTQDRARKSIKTPRHLKGVKG